MTYPAIEKISRISGQSCFVWTNGVVVVAGMVGVIVEGIGVAGANVFAGAIFNRGGRGGVGVALGATGVVGAC